MRNTYLILLILIIGTALIYTNRTPIKDTKNHLQALNIQKEINTLRSEGLVCTTNTDCVVVRDIGPCSSGLLTSFNRNTNLKKIESLYREKYDLNPMEYQCAHQPEPTGEPHPICQQNTCVLTYITKHQ